MAMRARLAAVPGVGRVVWLGVRPDREVPMVAVEEVMAVAGRGLEGDRYVKGGNRQVTLVQAEHLPVIAALSGLEVTPARMRRNVVVAGINVHALGSGVRFAIGDEVILVGSGACAPCNKLDVLIGPGGFHAARGHGGITAKIERGGVIRTGDEVRALPASS